MFPAISLGIMKTAEGHTYYFTKKCPLAEIGNFAAKKAKIIKLSEKNINEILIILKMPNLLRQMNISVNVEKVIKERSFK